MYYRTNVLSCQELFKNIFLSVPFFGQILIFLGENMRTILLMLENTVEIHKYDDLFCHISQEQCEKISKMKNDSDKKRSLFAHLLIKKAASEQLSVPFSEIIVKKDIHGKPYIYEKENYFFSVSHSGRAVLFSGDFERVGVDIELLRERKSTPTKRFFTENELSRINSDEDFFKVWTRKEAYSKLIGKGLAAKFSSFDVTDDSTGCEYYSEKYNEYIFSICSNSKIGKPYIIYENDFVNSLFI